MRATWLIRLYPREWRQRYEEEMRALLEQHQATLATYFDVLLGALDAHLNPEAWRHPISGFEEAKYVLSTTNTVVGLSIAGLVLGFPSGVISALYVASSEPAKGLFIGIRWDLTIAAIVVIAFYYLNRFVT